MAQNIINILELPKGVVPVTSIVVGYPNEEPPLTDRLPFEAVVFDEKYPDLSDSEINELFKEKEESDFTKALIEENQTENLAQIFTQKRYKKSDNLHFSKEFLKILENQGFMNNEG